MLVPQLLPARPPAGAAPPGQSHPGRRRVPRAARAGPDASPFDAALLQHEQTFDLVVKLRAENEREANVLRDMAMAQLKKDDENMKKWIALI